MIKIKKFMTWFPQFSIVKKPDCILIIISTNNRFPKMLLKRRTFGKRTVD